MSRVYCNSCHRPQVSCICHLFTSIDNSIHVVVLQHPSEVKQVKGTATLLVNSLASAEVFVGEDFAEHQDLLSILTKYQGHIALLYPSEHAVTIDAGDYQSDIRCLILLDGTWKKAYRLFMINRFLHHLPHLILPSGVESRYQIRQTKKQGALSTLEACCHALNLLESRAKNYHELLNRFEQFNQLQMSFRAK
ncbi:DTW domain-containing protein [Thalassotalea insulae]|uniref:tRNA-uridine aminocarboxypropyltransferase n=1 Tax=Thalassotalea insulae TaxID=2056778 RepID=A0ABQ6GZT3_9GAMM|nr:tRNA-uridine aminocarboxypropyltransferase [Thalassotalea insulae]GLX80072.1 DTW domain-containing protein [Thalassotalea insulae]